jgi:uncharacterized membrane protein
MKTRTVLIIIMITGILMMGAGYYLSGTTTVNLATHWNAAGEADGFGSPFMAFYFLPLLTMTLSILISVMPAIDPLKVNVETFRREYNLFIVAFAAFMFYIQGLTLAWNAGLKFSMNAMMTPGFGLLFVVTGLMIRKAKRNYFIGIKTPWTLANDTVWEKTHNLGGQLFVASGVLTTACVFYPDAAITVLLVTAIGASLITTVYSYLEFRKIEKSATTR